MTDENTRELEGMKVQKNGTVYVGTQFIGKTVDVTVEVNDDD